MTSQDFDSNNWQAIRGSGSLKTAEENMSLCAEIFIQHERFDAPATIKNAAGIMVDRHIWRERRIKSFVSPDRNYPGEDEAPEGAHISLASQQRGDDGLGGELYEEKIEQGPANDQSLTAHQREWDYLERHVEAAYKAYPQQANSWPNEELSDWQKVEALARYAMLWKMKTADVYCSFHPVDVLFHSSYCTGSACVLQALAMVAGFQTRFIAISYHSTIEILVNGRWIWADNIWSNGGVTPMQYNYAVMTADPYVQANLNDRQKEIYDAHTARYRAPYQYSGSMYWHFMSGEDKGRGVRDDISDGFGVSVPYDPSCAAALYP
ncbi:MAG: hypothetical protein HRU15_02070, partial [Planctomycetes bacterium]|nr:hypothetical protein [Planctomycetota bacterium]